MTCEPKWQPGHSVLIEAVIERVASEGEMSEAAKAEKFYDTPDHGWTCFHCGENFPGNLAGSKAAQQHFGAAPDSIPGCRLRMRKGEHSLLRRIRWLEDQLRQRRTEDSKKAAEYVKSALEAEDASAVNTEILNAIVKLSNEVLGTLPLMEMLCRQQFGNTNYNILIQRAEEARTAISSAKRGE